MRECSGAALRIPRNVLHFVLEAGSLFEAELETRYMRIVLLLGSLSTGGTERQFVQMAHELVRRKHNVTVVTLFPGGEFCELIGACEALESVALCSHRPSHPLGIILQFVRSVFALGLFLKRSSPVMLYSAAYMTNIIAFFSSILLPKVILVWGLRASKIEYYSWKMRLPFLLCSFLSRMVPLIVSNSQEALKYHEDSGFSGGKHCVIPNGINTDYFKPDLSARRRVRDEFAVPDSHKVIGIVGRLDAMKGHELFLQAAAIITRSRSDVHFLCVGSGSDGYARVLKTIAERIGMADRLIWTGHRRDIPDILNGLDILVSSSYGEGFSNVIGEAMACEVPCVVTDVGDSALVVGNTGIVVPSGSSRAIAEACMQMLDDHDTYEKMRILARRRVRDMFSLRTLADRTEDVLCRVSAGMFSE